VRSGSQDEEPGVRELPGNARMAPRGAWRMTSLPVTAAAESREAMRRNSRGLCTSRRRAGNNQGAGRQRAWRA